MITPPPARVTAQLAKPLSHTFLRLIVQFGTSLCIGKNGPIQTAARGDSLSGRPADVDEGDEGTL